MDMFYEGSVSSGCCIISSSPSRFMPTYTIEYCVNNRASDSSQCGRDGVPQEGRPGWG